MRKCQTVQKNRGGSSRVDVDVAVTRSDKFPAVPEVSQTSSSTRCSTSEEGDFAAFSAFFATRQAGLPGVVSRVELVSMTVVAIASVGVDIHTHPAASQTTTNNTTHPHTTHNNNNKFWRGSLLTGGELNHALSQASGPNPIPAIPPYVIRTPHLHGGPTTEETV